jgi:hypothetical protein
MAIGNSRARPRRGGTWQAGLRRRISWTLLLKLFALLALWLLFFSPAQRIPVTPDTVEALLSVDAVGETGKPLAEGFDND